MFPIVWRLLFALLIAVTAFFTVGVLLSGGTILFLPIGVAVSVVLFVLGFGEKL